MGQKIFLDSIYQSMQDSAREVRLSLGRPSSHATRQQALQQVAMLQAAKEAACKELGVETFDDRIEFEIIEMCRTGIVALDRGGTNIWSEHED